jgi:hypothetical protein
MYPVTRCAAGDGVPATTMLKVHPRLVRPLPSSASEIRRGSEVPEEGEAASRRLCASLVGAYQVVADLSGQSRRSPFAADPVFRGWFGGDVVHQ